MGVEGEILERLDRLERQLEELMPILRDMAEAKPAQEWFSIEEVAMITGLSADHVRRHVTTGLLPVSNQGTYDKPYYRIRRSDVDEWMMKRRETPSPAPRKKKAATTYTSRHHRKASG